MTKPIVNITPNYMDAQQIKKLERAGYVVVVNFGFGGNMEVHNAPVPIEGEQVRNLVNEVLLDIIKNAVIK